MVGHIRRAAVGAAVLLVVGFTPDLESHAAGAAADTLSSDEQRAQDFRRAFGFDASADLVRRAATSGDFSADPYGAPLSLAERYKLPVERESRRRPRRLSGSGPRKRLGAATTSISSIGAPPCFCLPQTSTPCGRA